MQRRWHDGMARFDRQMAVMRGTRKWDAGSRRRFKGRELAMLRVLKNLASPAYAPVILGKIRSRMFEHVSRSDIEFNLSWLERVSEEFDPLAKLLDDDLWSESRAFGEDQRVRAERLLGESDARFGGGGYSELLYFLTRHINPRAVVETGVAAGFSTRAFLKAMDTNGQGRLYSSDFPYVHQFRLERHEQHIGILVEQELQERWDLHLEGDRRNLPRILAKVSEINMFHYDSDKRYSAREFAISAIHKALANDGIIVMDDIQDDLFFHDYGERESSPWKVFRYQNKYVGVVGLHDPRI